MLKVNNLSIGYSTPKSRAKTLYSSLNFSLKKGELTALLGVNGAGKSTLIKTLCGFTPPLSGEVLLAGESLVTMSHHALSKRLGVVLTDRIGDGGLTVFELVCMGRYPHLGFFASPSSFDHKVVEQSLEKLHITHLKDRYIGELSDGERQRAMIAKVLAQECDIIILDEPTAFLDAKSRVETIVLLRQIAVEEQKCVILSTHDIEITLRYADTLMLLSRERGLTVAATEDMVLSGQINQLFGEVATTFNQGVNFDMASGSFQVESKVCRRGVTIAGGEVELFWLQNMLKRESFQPIVTTDKSSADVVILSATEIVNNIVGVRHNSLKELLTSLINNC